MTRLSNIHRNGALFSRVAICALAVALTAPAVAQDQAPAEGGGIADIVVTAQRRENRLQDVPIAVSAISNDALANFQAGKTEDLQRVVPGLKLLTVTSNPSNFQVSLRGSVQQDSSLVVAESPVGFYVDDLYIARLNGANAQLADIDRVEVLRGPQGTLYGRNTLAGAVKLVTVTPGDTTRIRASASYGDFNSYRLSGTVAGKLSEGGIYGSIAGLVNGTDGYYKNLATQKFYGRQENMGVRGKLRIVPDGPLSVEFTGSYARSKNDAYVPSFTLFPTNAAVPQVRTSTLAFPLGSAYAVNLVANPALPRPIEPLPRGETEQTILGLNLSYELSDEITARSIFGYVKTKDFFSIDFTGVGAFNGANSSDTSQYSQEIQLLGSSFDDRLNWLVGAYVFRENADQIVALISNDRLRVDTNSLSFFANGDLAITEQLGITAGARWTQDRKKFIGEIRNFGTLTPLFPGSSVALSKTFDALTPKLGINYKIKSSGVIDSLLLYGSVGRGFKSGGFNGIAFGNIDVLRAPYDPEKNWTYEIGLKTDLFGNKLRINAAAYINEITDVTMTTLLTANGNVSFPVQNAGNARVKGLELEVSARPIQWLNVFANATFQDAKYTSLRPGSAAAGAAAAFGKAELPQIPSAAFTVGFDAAVPSPFQESGAFIFGVNHFHTNDYFIGAANDVIIDGYGRTNAFVGYRFNENIEMRLEATNIDNGVDISTGARIFSAVAVEAPRQLMFTVSFKK